MGIRARELLSLVTGDVVVLLAAVWLALASRHLSIPTPAQLEAHLGPFAVAAVGWVGVYALVGLYDKHTLPFLRELTGRLGVALALGAFLTLAIFVVLPTPLAPKTTLLLYAGWVGVLTVLWRLAWVRQMRRAHDRALLVGDSDAATRLFEEVNAHPFRYSFRFVELVPPALVRERCTAMEGTDSAVALVVVEATHPDMAPVLPGLVGWALARNARIVSLEALYEQVFDAVTLEPHAVGALLTRAAALHRSWYLPLKRAGDIVLALLALPFVALLIPVVWLAYRWEGVDGSIWYVHERVGKGLRPFRAYKFRTLQRLDPEGTLAREGEPNPPTRVGKVLRALSLDELPQVWNVLRGEMSFIGPRADARGVASRLFHALPLYPLRYLVPPGITGWAQTHQRYVKGAISPETVEECRERLSYDLFYLLHMSPLLDCAIAVRTIRTIGERILTLVRRSNPVA